MVFKSNAYFCRKYNYCIARDLNKFCFTLFFLYMNVHKTVSFYGFTLQNIKIKAFTVLTDIFYMFSYQFPLFLHHKNY